MIWGIPIHAATKARVGTRTGECNDATSNPSPDGTSLARGERVAARFACPGAMAVAAGQDHRALGARRQPRHPVAPVRARPAGSPRPALRGREPLRRRRQYRLRRGREVAARRLHDHDRVRSAGDQSAHVRQRDATIRCAISRRSSPSRPCRRCSPCIRSVPANNFAEFVALAKVAAEHDQCRHLGPRRARPSRHRAARRRPACRSSTCPIAAPVRR